MPDFALKATSLSPEPELSSALKPIDDATRRVSTSSLGGLKTLRVLNESRLLQIIESMVEARLQSRLPQAADEVVPAGLAPESEAVRKLRAEYRSRWEEFHRSFEGKLRTIEERLHGRPAAPSPRAR